MATTKPCYCLRSRNHSMIHLTSVLLASALHTSSAFHLPQPAARHRAILSAKSICTFDSTDFAGKQGDWPYTNADLNRIDNSNDSFFYDEPRFVTHIDDQAISLLTAFYREEFSSLSKKEKGPLDMEYIVQDLNQQPTLSQFEDNSFDVICNVVSVDYLTKPLEIFQEMHRILRPGGISLMSFSDRCFPSKAVAMWLQADDIGRLTIVASYYHYSANWQSIEALDLKEMQATPPRPSAGEVFRNPAALTAWMTTAASVARINQGDPMFVVKGVK